MSRLTQIDVVAIRKRSMKLFGGRCKYVLDSQTRMDIHRLLDEVDRLTRELAEAENKQCPKQQ